MYVVNKRSQIQSNQQHNSHCWNNEHLKYESDNKIWTQKIRFSDYQQVRYHIWQKSVFISENETQRSVVSVSAGNQKQWKVKQSDQYICFFLFFLEA